MLDSKIEYTLAVLRASMGIEDVNQAQLQSEDENDVARIVIRNGILLTVYNELTPTLKELLKQQYYAGQKQSIIQDYEGEIILGVLDNSGLNCIALKGWEMRKLYPNIHMRQMADLDILVKPYLYEKIKEIMEEQGYTTGSESSWKHDCFSKKPVNIELHKRLTDDSGSIQVWEKEMWDRAICTTSHRFKMSPEDYYIFHFVHLHKDFLNGSLGLRRIVDTWLLQRETLDMDFIRTQLELFGMMRFHDRMVHLSKAVMCNENMDENDELLINHAFLHGIYGTDKSYKAGRIAVMGDTLNKGKMQSKISAVFLPYKRMKAQFPILVEHPILLPICWLKRIIRFLRGNMSKNISRLNYGEISEKDYLEMKAFLKAGGVIE